MKEIKGCSSETGLTYIHLLVINKRLVEQTPGGWQLKN